MRKNNIRWFLDAHDGLESMVDSIVEAEDSRRSYSIKDCGEKEAFVKFFLERDARGTPFSFSVLRLKVNI